MKRYIIVLAMVICCLGPLSLVRAASDPADLAGSADPALFSRMPHFHIQNYEVLEFDRQEFLVGPGVPETVEGRKTQVSYYVNDGATLPSGLQITRNYVTAATAIGGREVFSYEDGGTEYAVIRVTSNDKDVWAEVSGASNGMYQVRMIERQVMQQEVTANAAAMVSSIRDTGRVALYGIYFDTNKAELKPTSDPTMAEIARMLDADATLKLFVVGHTDTTGPFAANVQLSQARATAVVTSLVSRYGIAAERLTPFGCGPTVPVASNASEDGRAKNRRVELVAQ